MGFFMLKEGLVSQCIAMGLSVELLVYGVHLYKHHTRGLIRDHTSELLYFVERFPYLISLRQGRDITILVCRLYDAYDSKLL